MSVGSTELDQERRRRPGRGRSAAIDWRSKKTVLLLIGAVCLLVFAGGMAAAWRNRHTTLCPDGKAPVKQQDYLLGQTRYLCPDGRIVTTS